MIKDDRRKFLLEKNNKLIAKLNELIGADDNKVMSQRQLAKYLECSNSTVARWLKGEIPLNIEYAVNICKILNLDINEYIDLNNLFSLSLNNNSFLSLNEENKQKVFEYINYLLFLQNNNEVQKKENQNIYSKKMLK